MLHNIQIWLYIYQLVFQIKYRKSRIPTINIKSGWILKGTKMDHFTSLVVCHLSWYMHQILNNSINIAKSCYVFLNLNKFH